jgi:putative membrane protein
MNDYTGMSGFGMGFGWIIAILFIGVFIYFINNLVKSDSSAKDILDKRYANGEIDAKEYKIKKEALDS